MASGTSGPPNDIERIDKMFTKASWLIGVLWTVGIVGFFSTFLYSYNLIHTVADSLEKKVTTVSQSSEQRITEISKNAENRVEDASKRIVSELTETLISRVDLDKLQKKIEEQQIGLMQERLKEKMSSIEDSINNRIQIIKNEIDNYSKKVDSISEGYRETIKIQKELGKLQLQISDLDITPFLKVKPGNQAQLQAKITARGLEKLVILTLKIEFEVLENTWTAEARILGPNEDSSYQSEEVYVTKSIIFPKQYKDQFDIGPGEYSLLARVLSSDGKIIFAQASKKVRVE